MRSSKSPLLAFVVLAYGLFPALPARADDEANSQITPVVTVAPNLFAVGQFATTFVCLSNGNPASTKSIEGGDTFKLTFDPSIGVVAAVASPVLVNSASLSAADFTASLGPVPNQIVISYQGATKLFAPGDSFCVKVTFTANNVIGSGKVTGESPASDPSNGRYNSIDPKYTTISIVDFATGPQGPPGPGSVTSVSASSPLAVTNPTTTPTISLGIVPAANGGTGLSAAGAAGNFLRSNGSAWTSGPLAATDLPAGSGYYIQNATSQQAASNFNISGNGAANVFDAATQFNLGGSRILSQPGINNLAAGLNAGAANTTGTANAFFGQNAGQSNTAGTSNQFFGFNAGNRTTTGSNNVFVGDAAGYANTTGSHNAFFGSLAGFQNTANSNSFFGDSAGRNNTSGNGNAFYGASAGFNNTTASENAFFGVSAGFANTTGSANSFFGLHAGDANTTGSANVFFGRTAGFSNTAGNNNSFVGQSAGGFNATGSNNSFFGYVAGLSNATGNNLTVLGAGANVGAPDLDHATAIGAGAVVGASNTVVLGRGIDTVQIPGALAVAGSTSFGGTFSANVINAATQYSIGGSRVLSADPFNLFAGLGAGAANAGHDNSFFGNGAGSHNTAGNFNSFFGSNAGAANTTGLFNSFFGHAAGLSNTIGDSNAFFGFRAGSNNSTGGSNSFFGFSAGLNNTDGSSNAFFGISAGSANETGGSDAFFGALAGLRNTTGNGNSFFGVNAGGNNTTGGSNAFFGGNAGFLVATESGNSFFGTAAGQNQATGGNNTFVGYNTNNDVSYKAGNNNTLLGAFSVVGMGVANSSAIGYRAAVAQNDSLVLGSIQGVNGATTNTNVGIGTTAPKARLDVTGGNILVGSPGQGIILKSPDGTQCRLLSIDNSGNMVLAALACP